MCTKLRVSRRKQRIPGIEILKLYYNISTTTIQRYFSLTVARDLHIRAVPYSHDTPNYRVESREQGPAGSLLAANRASCTDRSRCTGTGFPWLQARSIRAVRRDCFSFPTMSCIFFFDGMVEEEALTRNSSHTTLGRFLFDAF